MGREGEGKGRGWQGEEGRGGLPPIGDLDPPVVVTAVRSDAPMVKLF